MSNDNPNMTLLNGGRPALEREVLEALFTPGAETRVQDLKARLARRGRIRLVDVGSAEPASASADGASSR
jgi:hypothetical protein